jgi:TetR/AcrR family transcriptional regulator, fatty acid metabolism regulator protein
MMSLRLSFTGVYVASSSSRDRIRESAKTLFAKHGYEFTPTAAICRQAGTTEAQLLKHFETKLGLLEAIFDDAWSQINPAIRFAAESVATPRERLRVLIDTILSLLGKDQDLLLLFLLEGRRIRDDGRFVVLVAGFLEFVQIVDGILSQAREAGELAPEIDPQAIRSGLMGAVEGLLRDQLLGRFTKYPGGYSESDLRAVCFRFVNSVMKEK